MIHKEFFAQFAVGVAEGDSGRRYGDELVLARASRLHETSRLELLDGVVGQVGVLYVQDQHDVDEPLGAIAMTDRMEDEDFEGGQLGAGGGRASNHPALEGCCGKGQTELKLRQGGQAALRQMGGGNDDGLRGPAQRDGAPQFVDNLSTSYRRYHNLVLGGTPC
ncbi:hypothetical protein D3C72_1115480 [compost metagenome]